MILLVGAGVLEIGDITPQGPHAEPLEALLLESAEDLLACNETGQRQELAVTMRLEGGRPMMLTVDGPEDLAACVRGGLKTLAYDTDGLPMVSFPMTLVPIAGTTPASPDVEATTGPGLQVAEVAAKDPDSAQRVAELKLELATPCYTGARKGGILVVSSTRGVLDDGIGDAKAAECVAGEVSQWVWPTGTGSEVVITFHLTPESP